MAGRSRRLLLTAAAMAALCLWAAPPLADANEPPGISLGMPTEYSAPAFASPALPELLPAPSFLPGNGEILADLEKAEQAGEAPEPPPYSLSTSLFLRPLETAPADDSTSTGAISWPPAGLDFGLPLQHEDSKNSNSWLSSDQSSHQRSSKTVGLSLLNGNNKKTPSVNMTGQIQVDFVTFNQSEANKEAVGAMENAVGFRRARLGMFGEIFETTEYRIEFDFALSGRPRFLDNWIAIKDIDIPFMSNWVVGHFFEPFSLERYTPNRFITFVERSAVDVFAPARNTGVMTFCHSKDERWTWAVGGFRSDSNVFGDAVGDRRDWAATAHVTWLAWYDKESDGRYLLHLGASYSHRFMGDQEVRFAKRPGSQLQAFAEAGLPPFVDTGLFPSNRYQMVGLEAAWVHGPFSMQSELVVVPVNHIDGPDPTFFASYVYASYFLTGEHRSYSPVSILGRFREGIFQRIVPYTNAFSGWDSGQPRGLGAWELAARWEYIHLDDGGIQGGRMHILTAGVNWYLNPFTRLQLNYMRPILTTAGIGTSRADTFITRLGFEF